MSGKLASSHPRPSLVSMWLSSWDLFLPSLPPSSRLSSEDHPMDTEVQTEGASSSAIPLVPPHLYEASQVTEPHSLLCQCGHPLEDHPQAGAGLQSTSEEQGPEPVLPTRLIFLHTKGDGSGPQRQAKQRRGPSSLSHWAGRRGSLFPLSPI